MRTVSRENALIDFLLQQLNLKRDKQLADLLGVGYTAISKIRCGNTVSSDIILRIHEVTDIPVKTIKEYIK
jgi:transcriptional regulator with XRE-family HTH domain